MKIALGIIIGILLSLLLVLIDLFYRKKIHKAGVVEHLDRITDQKGEIIEPNYNEDLINELTNHDS